MFVIEVVEGELLEEIEAAAKGAGITDAAVVSLIGAVDDFTISSMPLNDATRDQPLNYAMPAEITGTGEIVSGKAHIHVVMAVQGNKALAGHLRRAEIRTHSGVRTRNGTATGDSGLNREHFAGSILPMPIVIGLTAFGRCIGLTRDGGWLDSPRITLTPELFNGNHRTAPVGAHGLGHPGPRDGARGPDAAR